MEPIETEKMTPFDRLVSSRQLQMLKLLIPYTPSSGQRILAIYIKFLELEHAIDFFQKSQRNMHAQTFKKTPESPLDIFNEIRPYLLEDERNSIDSIVSLIGMMEMMSSEGEQDMFELYNTIFNAGMDENSGKI